MSRRFFLISLLFISIKFCSAQHIPNPVFLQGGVTLNFLYESASRGDYGGPLGYVTTYNVDHLNPLIGFASGVITHARISENIFFRYGALVSYQVSALSLNEQATEGVIGLADVKENVNTRLRDLYLQLPLEIGRRNERNTYSIFGGFKFSVRAAAWSEWNYVHTSWSFAAYQDTLIINKKGPTQESSNLNAFDAAGDIAAELGSRQTLTGFLALEERFDLGLIKTLKLGGETVGPSLKHFTMEVVLGWKISRQKH